MKGAVRRINTVAFAAAFGVFLLIPDQEAVPLEDDRELLSALVFNSRTGLFEGNRRIIQSIQSQFILFVIVNGSLFGISVFVVILSEDITLVVRGNRYSVDIEFVLGFRAVQGIVSQDLNVLSGYCGFVCRKFCAVGSTGKSGFLFGIRNDQILVHIPGFFNAADFDLDVLFNIFDGIGSVTALFQSIAAGLYREVLPLLVAFRDVKGEAEAVTLVHGRLAHGHNGIAFP